MVTKNMQQQALDNTNFRKVLQTGAHSQVVLMSLLPQEEIGEEVHPDTDQIFFFVEGLCEAVINGESKQVTKNDLVFVPAGAKHNFINVGESDVKLFTIYSPPAHADGTIHKTKAEAEQAEHEY